MPRPAINIQAKPTPLEWEGTGGALVIPENFLLDEAGNQLQTEAGDDILPDV